jgi:hypothetical protein
LKEAGVNSTSSKEPRNISIVWEAKKLIYIVARYLSNKGFRAAAPGFERQK